MTLQLPEPDESSGEPALKVGAVTTVVTAVIGVGMAFGLDLTEAQVAAILALAACAPLVSAWFTRSRVFSPKTVAELLKGRR